METYTVIGDIHGCFDELCDLIQKYTIDTNSKNTIFVGDLINKGPKNKEVLDFVMQSSMRVVMGNHDRKFCIAYRNKNWQNESFKATKEQLGQHIEKYVTWLEQLPTYIKEEEVTVVHAGLQPGLPVEETCPKVLTEIRTWDGKGENMKNRGVDPYWFDLYKEKHLVVYGHDAILGSVIREYTIGVDTGCVYGGSLSAIRLPSREIIRVPARAQYAAVPK